MLAQLRTLRSTTGGTCRRYLQLSHRPDGNLADVLTSTLACTTAAGDLVNFSKYVLQRPSMFPIAPMGDSHFARCLQGGGFFVYSGTVTLSSCTITGNTASNVRAHDQKFPLPRWETHICSLFAGWRCRSLWRHSDHLIVHHQWEFSFFCARSSSKVPNAPMGKLLTRVPRLTLAQLRPGCDAPVNSSGYVPQRGLPNAPMGK